MKRKLFVLGVVVILSGSTMLPAVIGSEDMDEKIMVKVRTSLGTINEREISPAVETRLQSIISQLNNNTDKYKTLLPALLSILEDCGLIENAEKMELAIKGDIRNENDSIWKQQSLFFNIFCFVAGYGHGSMLMTPMMLLLKLLPLPISMLIFFYQTLRPRLFVPLGGWLVAEGKMDSIGLLGYQHFSIGVGNASPLPNCVILIGFTGLWISILKKGVENEYFVGSAMAVFGG
ncbi:MAG: hypothetical protein DRN31_04585 [Thermoplasmata archaeon]|nr:MAG: hypothetical protein DRN31_04585 [Thermoplasmata archaeon]